MNNVRRVKIRKIVGLLEEIRDDEQSAHDSLPENLAWGERGDTMENNILQIEDAIQNLEDLI